MNRRNSVVTNNDGARHGRRATTNATIKKLYDRAEKYWAAGRLREALDLFLTCAKSGFSPAFYIVGSFYDFGKGVATDESQALHWYRLAYRECSCRSAANNIACIYRDRGEYHRALWWFHRAVALGDHDAHLLIAKLLLRMRARRGLVRKHLLSTIRSPEAIEESKTEAERLLRERARPPRRKPRQARRA